MRRTKRKTRRPTPYFCPKCVSVYEAPVPGGHCTRCGGALISITDHFGQLTREYLLARGRCCFNYCTHCPWGHGQGRTGEQESRGTGERGGVVSAGA